MDKIPLTASSTDKLPEEAYIQAVTIPFISHWSKIRCGSYTAEWVARVIGVKPKPVPVNSILRGPVWFDVFRPVLPYDMGKLLRFKGMKSLQVRLSEFSNREKIRWIKNQIVSTNRPPILLIRTKVLHWIAVAGYDDKKELFYVYDSRFGKNSLDSKMPIGNFTFSYDDLLSRWNGRWNLRFIALVITDIDTE